MKPIPYGKQDINEADIQAVIRVLKSDFLTQGPAVVEFEKKISSYCQVPYVLAVSNATAALHLGCMALGIGPDDEVWTSPNTFVASANCAIYCGAKVDFVDIEPDTYNLDVDALEAKLKERTRLKQKLPRLLIPVHHSGQSCDMKRIHQLSRQYGFKIMEDASHAIGGSYEGKKVGSCQYSDLTVFSLHPVKIITTGEGGVLLTQNSDLHEKLLRLRSHGITRNPSLMTHPPDGPWYYQQIELGYNYRITDIQAALGVSQLDRLDSFVARRQTLAHQYEDLLRKLPIRLPVQREYAQSALHLYPIRLKLSEIKKTQKQVFEALHKNQILVNLHYIPVYLQPYYEALGFQRGLCPEAESYYAEAVSLPMYASLTDDEQKRVAQTLKEVLQ